MSSESATFDAASFQPLPEAEPTVRPMGPLPRAIVWAVLIGGPWVAIVQIVRMVF
ncbi:hypothetical protein [Azospirillum thermophilum]|uniref:hypothetical protein n=1 Tax=Azospirillum thermophilum TaxID=2202148 RepID=UPI00143DED43|nr:hypothetical protein [Azospirillum thermophilum]